MKNKDNFLKISHYEKYSDFHQVACYQPTSQFKVKVKNTATDMTHVIHSTGCCRNGHVHKAITCQLGGKGHHSILPFL